MDGVKDIVRDGDTFYVPSSVPHGVVALERSVILDIFTPQRQDFLK
jgi:quercetin dioxygenase-like cupin family protein